MGRSLEHANFTFPRGYLFGLTLSTAGSSATFSVAAGEAVDSTFVGNMTLGSSISKTTSAWAVGSTNGALDTGTIANSTWYHVYLIKRPDTGVVDVLISLSATSPTLPTNYTIFRRIGAMKTDGSGNWTAFTQIGDDFIWTTATSDVTNSTMTSGSQTLYTLGVPSGVKVRAHLNAFVSTNSNFVEYYLHSPDAADQASSVSGTPNSVRYFSNQVASNLGLPHSVYTDTSGRVAARCNSTQVHTISISTVSWEDTRGRFG